jgi:hypothetical protein
VADLNEPEGDRGTAVEQWDPVAGDHGKDGDVQLIDDAMQE